MQNLSPVGKPVTGKDLIGREKEISDICSLVSQGQSIVLIAPRRFGKTSIVLEVIKRMKKQNIFTSYVDLFSAPTIGMLAEQITGQVLANKKLDAAFSKFKDNIKYLLKNIEFKQEVEDSEFILSFADKSANELKLLSESIDFIEKFAAKYDQHLLMGFDEFGDLEKYNGGSIVKLFRSKLQLQKHTTFIFSGSYESVMNKLFITPKSPFYRFARILNIGFIEKDIFRQHISERLLQNNLRITAPALNAILDFTNGHPYYTQLFIQQLLIQRLAVKTIEVKEIEMIKQLLVYIEINYLEKTWEEVSKSKENIPVIIALAKGETSVYAAVDSRNVNITRSLRKLVNSGLLAKAGRKYIFNDPLFHYWLVNTMIKK